MSESRVFRSQDEISAEIERIKDTDLIGFKTCDLIGYLDYEHAKKYLTPECTESEWNPIPSDRESVLKQMESYMPFAFEKANGQRGISAERSMAHYTVWVWMIGDEKRFGDLEDYQYYGITNLRMICDAYGWDYDKWDSDPFDD